MTAPHQPPVPRDVPPAQGPSLAQADAAGLQPALLHSSFAPAFRAWLAAGELRYARCALCGLALGFTRRRCGCGHAGLVWTPASGGATLHTFTVYHQAYAGAFPPPWTVGQVELDEGPRLVAAFWPGTFTPRLGMRLAATVHDARLVFTPAGAAERQDASSP